jgi:hypothetical protein
MCTPLQYIFVLFYTHKEYIKINFKETMKMWSDYFQYPNSLPDQKQLACLPEPMEWHNLVVLSHLQVLQQRQ